VLCMQIIHPKRNQREPKPISKNVKKQEILWYELIHNYIPFLLKTSKGTRNFIRSMTLYVSMFIYIYPSQKRIYCLTWLSICQTTYKYQ
jgi:hypothetical protein